MHQSELVNISKQISECEQQKEWYERETRRINSKISHLKDERSKLPEYNKSIIERWCKKFNKLNPGLLMLADKVADKITRFNAENGKYSFNYTCDETCPTCVYGKFNGYESPFSEHYFSFNVNLSAELKFSNFEKHNIYYCSEKNTSHHVLEFIISNCSLKK